MFGRVLILERVVLILVMVNVGCGVGGGRDCNVVYLILIWCCGSLLESYDMMIVISCVFGVVWCNRVVMCVILVSCDEVVVMFIEVMVML